MITHLNGTVEKIADNYVVVDVNGVGYGVTCSARTINEVKAHSGLVHIVTLLNIREDAWTLYGFISEQEKFWFNMLISVQGVGGKVAIAILSALSDDDLYNAFLSGDKTILTRADGVGPKLASRIIMELKDKIVGKADLNTATMKTLSEPGVVGDVVSALSNLGYQRTDILRAISSAQFDKNCRFDVLLKLILHKLSGSDHSHEK
ncbi:MAG: Holliday junction branch migration protein RuvA [Holosporaceae bacterium]|jgi:Holliday junction DNA helicase RuvA|nr:Holliday junction branch migration protein RuvA [Holosporaceae bacterium]